MYYWSISICCAVFIPGETLTHVRESSLHTTVIEILNKEDEEAVPSREVTQNILVYLTELISRGNHSIRVLLSSHLRENIIPIHYLDWRIKLCRHRYYQYELMPRLLDVKGTANCHVNKSVTPHYHRLIYRGRILNYSLQCFVSTYYITVGMREELAECADLSSALEKTSKRHTEAPSTTLISCLRNSLSTW